MYSISMMAIAPKVFVLSFLLRSTSQAFSPVAVPVPGASVRTLGLTGSMLCRLDEAHHILKARQSYSSVILYASNNKRNNSKKNNHNNNSNNNSSENNKVQRPENEFSRTFRVDGILSGGLRQRDYNVQVAATDEELAALGARFELKQIHSLEADLALRRERTSPKGVQVEGEVNARVSQVCVRTGEVFDVDVQFPLFAVVRPLGAVDIDIPPELREYTQDQRKRERMPNLNDMDMVELQKLLQDFDVEDDVFEDEAIYSTSGNIDLGELVAQLFWLKLDPYPKKPGSSPVQSSITG